MGLMQRMKWPSHLGDAREMRARCGRDVGEMWARCVWGGAADEVALALVERGDQRVHLVTELEGDAPVLRHRLREEVPCELGVTVGGALGHQREELLVEGVDVPVAEALRPVGHRRAEVLDREAAAGEGLAVEGRAVT